MSEANKMAEHSEALANDRLERGGYEWSVDADVQLRETAKELRRLSAELEECQAQRRAAFRRIEEQDKELEALKKAMGEPVRWVVESDLALPCCAAFDHPGIDYIPLYALTKDQS